MPKLADLLQPAVRAKLKEYANQAPPPEKPDTPLNLCADCGEVMESLEAVVVHKCKKG